MDSSKILQLVPDFKITCSVSGFDLLVVAQTEPQLVRHSLLGEAGSFPGRL